VRPTSKIQTAILVVRKGKEICRGILVDRPRNYYRGKSVPLDHVVIFVTKVAEHNYGGTFVNRQLRMMHSASKVKNADRGGFEYAFKLQYARVLSSDKTSTPLADAG
jgi:hypothetical protein